jgi:hypothetical protein
MPALSIIPAPKVGGSPVAFLRVVTPPALRLARCGECGLDPAHPAARSCGGRHCPLRHHATGAAK